MGKLVVTEFVSIDGVFDELRLMVFPTVLGRGRRLFPEGIDRVKLKLIESKQVGPDGGQLQIYRRADR